MAKVWELSHTKGLMVIVGLEEWKGGVISLLNSAEAKDIIPSAIVITRIKEINEMGENDEMSIVLWGNL